MPDSTFHNPYTFLPFGTNALRTEPTHLSIDEVETGRFTGVLRLTVRTLSPLLSCSSTPSRQAGLRGGKVHNTYSALTIVNDVIVPATGVRGALRSLLTVLTRGTLGYIDHSIWLCQGRDVNLGPRGRHGAETVPERVFLARIDRIAVDGSITVTVGRPNELPRVAEIERLLGRDVRRPGRHEHQGRLFRLSGRRIGNTTFQREGEFVQSTDPPIQLPPSLLEDFLGRHRHAAVNKLEEGDLVWLEPADASLHRLASADDVRSIQWARLGRHGQRLLDVVGRHHPEVLPDAMNPDGLVDEVTNLFGHVPAQPEIVKVAFPGDRGNPAAAFAARLRISNLVFEDGAAHLHKAVALAPLAAPHPGCLAFYRDQDDLDVISANDPLRGYKVYRTTSERGDAAPWHWRAQPVMRDATPQHSESSQNKTCDLLREGRVGTVDIACRGLSRREVELLLAACGVDWRLGGGKPLGLGHCRVVAVQLKPEPGSGEPREWTLDERVCNELDRCVPTEVGEGWSSMFAQARNIDQTLERELREELRQQAAEYQATQRPVARLRYPRAGDGNNQVGGHVWFGRYASPAWPNGDGDKIGVASKGLRRGRERDGRPSQPQRLPVFDANSPNSDTLVGYEEQ